MILKYSRSFKKDYKKLNSKLRKQCDERLILFRENQFNPLLNNHSVHHPYEGCQSINISGDVRALFEINNDGILFIRIGSHSELYK
ncbi:type II toxin-antitoxin system mRNA interferase toxin, RelE/StbE family [Candidatus Nomurabacteria bacterium]|nr:type II toxin-antitoxin system mRNA interferase toxin, RelE/StbE family [Candidatus Nomurabacteria bacterium]